MLKNLLIIFVSTISIFSEVLFSEVYGSANDGSSTDQSLFQNDIAEFTIKPLKLRMYPGGSMQLIATAHDSKGNKITITPEWIIKSDVTSLGEFDTPKGEKVVFNALNSGSGSIVAVYNNLEAEIQVEIFKVYKKGRKAI